MVFIFRSTALINSSTSQRDDLSCVFCEQYIYESGEVPKHLEMFHKIPKLTIESVARADLIELTTINEDLKCLICTQILSTRDILIRHYKTVHKIEKVLRYDCNQCDEKFSERNLLYKHRRELHNPFIKQQTTNNCHICSKDFNTPRGLNRHILLMHKNDEYFSYDKPEQTTYRVEDGILACSICEHVCVTRPDLIEHMEQTHNIENLLTFNCKQCDDAFAHEEHLLLHCQKVHSKETTTKEEPTTEEEPTIEDESKEVLSFDTKKIKMFTTLEDLFMSASNQFNCHICNENFSSARDLNLHSVVHTTGNNKTTTKKYACTICKTVFKKSVSLATHMQEAHSVNKVKVRHRCAVCGKNFPKLEEMIMHKKKEHPVKTVDPVEEEKIIIKMEEDECDADASESIVAVESVSGKSGKRRVTVYKCEICDLVIRHPSHIAMHIKRHTGQKDYVCDICGQAYFAPSALKSHVNSIHLNLRSYQCDICGAGFNTNPALKVHKIKHENNRPFVCEVCGKGFNHPSSLYVHKLFHDDKHLKHVCQICGKKFRRTTDLRVHTRIHTGERPVKCKVCGAGFTDTRILSKHMKGHKDSNKFKCKHCNANFTRVRYLERHEKDCNGPREEVEEVVEKPKVTRAKIVKVIEKIKGPRGKVVKVIVNAKESRGDEKVFEEFKRDKGHPEEVEMSKGSEGEEEKDDETLKEAGCEAGEVVEEMKMKAENV